MRFRRRLHQDVTIASDRPTGDGGRGPHATEFRGLADSDLLREFVHNLREGIYVSNSTGDVLDANPAFLEMVGVSTLDELRELQVQDLIVDPAQRRREIEILDRDGALREFELRIRRADGTERTVLDTTYASQDERTGETLYCGILVDITTRKSLEERLLELTVRDPLTGCFNRRYLADVVQKLDDEPEGRCGCVYIDIDHFKRYNDVYGHQAGDDVLVKVSRFLMRQVRAEEAVVRVGGDEFVVLLSGADGPHTEAVARRLQVTAGRSAPVPFSLGYSVRRRGEPLEQMIARADDRMLAVRVGERSENLRREGDDAA
ncbi:MAG: sensor domain-containing diguanylate cyclase [Gemmatimonadaceae bacterium]